MLSQGERPFISRHDVSKLSFPSSFYWRVLSNALLNRYMCSGKFTATGIGTMVTMVAALNN